MEMIYVCSGVSLCLFAFFVSLSNFFSRKKKMRKKNSFSGEEKKRKEKIKKEKGERGWKRRAINFSLEE